MKAVAARVVVRERRAEPIHDIVVQANLSLSPVGGGARSSRRLGGADRALQEVARGVEHLKALRQSLM
jgi:hypothetical protein